MSDTKVACYVRVSSIEQYEEGYSIGEQTERLTKYASAMGWDIHKIYTDGGYSGANTNRPALQELIEDVKGGQIHKVIVYKLDRLSRSQKDTLALIEDVFLPNNTDFVSMNENFDTSTPFGRAMIGILAVFAQLERESIKERTRMGKDARAKEGKWHGGAMPIGYDYNEATDELEINEFEAMQIRLIFDEFLRGVPLRTLETDFRNKGYKHKWGYWSPMQMRRAMGNTLYIGYIKHNDELIQGIHPPIIDIETFKRANKLLQERQKAYDNKGVTPRGQGSILGGFVWCGRCGARYARQVGRKRNSNSPMPPTYYTCYSRSKKVKSMIRNPNCKNDNWRADVLDKLILDEIRKLEIDRNHIETLKNAPKINENNNHGEIIKEQILTLEKQISRFMDLYALSNMSLDAVKDKIEPLNKQKKALEEQLQEFQPSQVLTVHEVQEIVKGFGDILDRGDINEIRLVVESLINRIELDGEEITIHWKFA